LLIYDHLFSSENSKVWNSLTHFPFSPFHSTVGQKLTTHLSWHLKSNLMVCYVHPIWFLAKTRFLLWIGMTLKQFVWVFYSFWH
jgi:hypothetical protein